MHYLYNDRVQVEGLADLPNSIGVVVDWFVGVKGQSIKVEFDESTRRWINVNDQTLKITRLEPLPI